MTYRELVEYCYNKETCTGCKYIKECKVFEIETKGRMPVALHYALDINLDAEIEVRK